MNHTAPTEQFDRVVEDVRQSRHHQIEVGYTPEHDDQEHPSAHGFVELGISRLRKVDEPGYYDRQMLIDGIAVLVAAVESWDRQKLITTQHS